MYECPGASSIKAPTIETLKCKKCGGDVEIFTDESSIKCDSCGTVVKRAPDLACIKWCVGAKECVGEEKYKELMGDNDGR
ncbi:MAG: hypothetical protein V3R86_07425 [Candidatus Hydrothermarchaeaceae archaeon]